MSRLVPLPCLLFLAPWACAPPEPAGPEPDALDELTVPVFEARVANRIAEFEGHVSEQVTESTEREPGDGELQALLEMFRTSRGRMREVPLQEVAAMGDAALGELTTMAEDQQRSGDDRNAALHLTSAIGTPAALEAVVAVLETAREPWRRAYAAWLLGQTEDDRFLLRMLLPLRYEKDAETVMWLAEALAKHGNYSGLDGLDTVVQAGGATAGTAAAKRDELVAASGLAMADATALQALWSSAESHERLEHEPSDALRLAAWRELEQLSSEHFQLRGVDDARFVLCRTGPWGARLVAEALVDEDAFVRLHATQVLERMGARARPVVPEMLPLLRDPRTAHAVAEALGAIGATEALPLLRAGLRSHRPHELRVASAHGLGKLADPAAVEDLRALLDDAATTNDLRLAVAGALARCGAGREAAEALVVALEDPYGDPQGAEVALAQWISDEAADDEEGFAELLEAWNKLEGPPALLRTREDTQARLEARAKLVRGHLEGPSKD